MIKLIRIKAEDEDETRDCKAFDLELHPLLFWLKISVTFETCDNEANSTPRCENSEFQNPCNWKFWQPRSEFVTPSRCYLTVFNSLHVEFFNLREENLGWDGTLSLVMLFARWTFHEMSWFQMRYCVVVTFARMSKEGNTESLRFPGNHEELNFTQVCRLINSKALPRVKPHFVINDAFVMLSFRRKTRCARRKLL